MSHHYQDKEYRSLAGLLLLIISISLGFLGKSFIPELAALPLITLITLSFFLDTYQILFLDLTAVFLMNWRPGIGAEMAVIALFPLMTHGLRKFLPGKLWINNVLCAVIGFIVLSAAIDIRILLSFAPLTLLESVIVIGVCASLIFNLYNYFYVPRV